VSAGSYEQDRAGHFDGPPLCRAVRARAAGGPPADLTAAECRFSVVACSEHEWLSTSSRCGGRGRLGLSEPRAAAFADAPKSPARSGGPGPDHYLAAHTGYDFVTVENRQGGAIAGAYLRNTGCRHPVVVGVRYEELGRMSTTSGLRLEGFQVDGAGHSRRRMSYSPKNYTASSGAEAAARVLNLPGRPDAIFATSDDLAAGICHVLIAHGVQPGKDIRLIGLTANPCAPGVIRGSRRGCTPGRAWPDGRGVGD